MSLPDLVELAGRLDEGAIEPVVRELESITERVPGFAVAHLLLARAYRLRGDRERALEALSRCWFWLGDAPGIREEYLALARSEEIGRAEGSDDSAQPEGSDESAQPEEDADPGAEPPVPAGDRPEELEADLQERFGDPDEVEDVEDLDTLIRELEGARISPEPDVGSTGDPAEDEEADEKGGEVVSETLARIYERQKEYAAAAEAYRELSEEHPDRSEEFREKSKEMERRARQS